MFSRHSLAVNGIVHQVAVAIASLENNNSCNHHCEVDKNIQNKISKLMVVLMDRDEKFSLSVKAANARSKLVKLAQDRGMKPHIRMVL
jgi:uncharacterized protein (UPF0147 family)